jgi:glycosyltransferase involved in cell wall biosynthesis
MKIGLDAKWYFDGPPSGKVVIRHLVEEIARSDRRDEIFLFLDRRWRDTALPAFRANVKPIYVWARNNLLSNVFVLPRHERRLAIDVSVVQNFSSVFKGARRIAFIHDALFLSHPEFYSWIERLYFAPMRLLAHRAQGICTVSETERQRLLDLNFKKGKDDIPVVYHGVDSCFRPKSDRTPHELAAVAAKYKLPERFLLYVGRLNVRKNVDNLLRALPNLAHQEIPLVIVGSKNWKSSNHQRLAQRLGVLDRIVFAGPVYGDELGTIYSLAEVVCFPSLAESFGLPALEAMASGVPVVVSNTTSLPEICGEAGNYVCPDDPHDIARMVDRLLDEPQLYRAKREAGLFRASQFTWRASAARLLEYIDTVYLRPK